MNLPNRLMSSLIASYLLLTKSLSTLSPPAPSASPAMVTTMNQPSIKSKD